VSEAAAFGFQVVRAVAGAAFVCGAAGYGVARAVPASDRLPAAFFAHRGGPVPCRLLGRPPGTTSRRGEGGSDARLSWRRCRDPPPRSEGALGGGGRTRLCARPRPVPRADRRLRSAPGGAGGGGAAARVRHPVRYVEGTTFYLFPETAARASSLCE